MKYYWQPEFGRVQDFTEAQLVGFIHFAAHYMDELEYQMCQLVYPFDANDLERPAEIQARVAVMEAEEDALVDMWTEAEKALTRRQRRHALKLSRRLYKKARKPSGKRKS